MAEVPGMREDDRADRRMQPHNVSQLHRNHPGTTLTRTFTVVLVDTNSAIRADYTGTPVSAKNPLLTS
jgi:hypothetical protein